MSGIVILGAAVGPDGPSPSLVRRTEHAAALYHRGMGTLVIPCGGLGLHPPTEAEAMKSLLEMSGVPEAAIHCDDASRNTLENLLNAKGIMAQTRVTRAFIVTDKLHAPRAALTAWAIGLSAETNTPSLEGMPIKTRLRRFRHEALSFPFYLLRAPWWRWRYRKR